MLDVLAKLFMALTVLAVGFAVYFLVLGLWRTFLVFLLEDARSAEGRATVGAMRRAVLRRMARFNQGRFVISPKFVKRIDASILMAGGLDGLTAAEFRGMQQLSFLGFTLFALILVTFLRTTLGVSVHYAGVLLMTLGGYFFPEIWLHDQVKNRHKRITRDLPYTMDLLTLAVEAGLDFQAAVGTVVQKGKTGPILEEFTQMLQHLRMGKTREEALRMIGARVNLPQLSSFVSALIQADRMGTSLGKVLRIQSSQMRVERTQRAEKLANEAPVKMLFPLIAFIFPTVFMILFGPLLFQLMTGEF